MKISAKEEYALRLILRIAKNKEADGLNINQLSEVEGISVSYAAKISRTLRMKGYIKSTRGPKGGYVLASKPEEIYVSALLKAVDGPLFDNNFCNSHTGIQKLCTNSIDCSSRSLWRVIQLAVDRVLEKVTLQHLMGPEYDSDNFLQEVLEKQILTQSIFGHINDPAS